MLNPKKSVASILNHTRLTHIQEPPNIDDSQLSRYDSKIGEFSGRDKPLGSKSPEMKKRRTLKQPKLKARHSVKETVDPKV